MQMSSLHASDFPVKNFCKLAQHAETMRKNVREKSNGEHSSIGVQTIQTTLNRISICFFTITAEILARSLANFYCQYADRHINSKIRATRQRARAGNSVIYYRNKHIDVSF